MALEPKQQVFVDKYFELGFNATKAALAAGYSKRSARSIASENLTKPDIKAEIERRLSEHAMSANEVLVRLTEHARGDMREFMGLNETELKEHPLGNLIKKVERTEIRNSKGLIENTIKIELYDAQAALVHIGKHHKLFTDKQEVTGENGKAIPIAITGMDVSQL